MPPSRRSTRIKNVRYSQELTVSSINAKNQTAKAPVQRAKALGVNTKGLPIFPDELLLEIISYYPVTPIRYTRHPDIIDRQNIRHRALYALSQTCVNLRRFSLRSLWERIEVCRHGRMKGRTLALELIRQLEIVTIRNPPLAQYVQIVNVDISIYARASVLTELARCLALFPHLHTVWLKIEDMPREEGIAKPFKGYVFESVRTAVVSSNAREFFKCCPQSLRCEFLCDST